jgi:spore coat polysaccharide biosynthesis predicted glycosyltransferase SpsG
VKTFWIACESGQDTGLGHLTRCIAIAEELKERNLTYCFEHLSIIDSRGCELLKQSDLLLTCNCVSSPNYVIIDSCNTKFIGESQAKANCHSILLVDETSPNFFANSYIEASPIKNWLPVNKSAKIFLFECNPILRKAFDDPIRNRDLVITPTKILITLGAAKNRKEILDTLVPVIRRDQSSSSEISLIIGGADLEELLEQCQYLQISPVFGTPNLKLMLDSFDYVISAAGVTAWELISLKMPGFLIGVTDNQIQQVKYLRENRLRDGLVYKDPQTFSLQLKRVLFIKNDEFNDDESQRNLKNGRKAVVSWILDHLN